MIPLEIIAIIRGGIELAQLYQALAIQTAARAGMTTEERLELFKATEQAIKERDPDLIPDG